MQQCKSTGCILTVITILWLPLCSNVGLLVKTETLSKVLQHINHITRSCIQNQIPQ